MPSLTEEIGNIKRDINTLKDEVTGTGDVVGLGSQIVGTANIINRTNVLIKNVMSSDTFVIDDSTRNTLNGNFLLVGAGYTDGLDSSTWEQVLNKDNTYYENFDHATFIDSSSTGTHIEPSGLVEGYYELDSGEILYSELVALKPSTTYTKATLNVTNTGSVDLQVSGDGGSNYQTVTNATQATITIADTNGIKYKLTGAGGSGGFPTAFGTWGGGAGSSNVTSVELKYS